MSYSFAVVGSGPAGFYAAEALVKARDDVRVDVLDRLPTPYGLVRSGVAPDHQGTKNVWRVFARTAARERVRFLGNVDVGRDVSLAELRDMYDAVVLAVGASVDRKLGINGEDLPGVIGSGAFTSWYNGHPDFGNWVPDLGDGDIAVVGNGNVAIDIVRILALSPREMASTDLPEYATKRIEQARFKTLHLLGRRGPLQASFTPVELRELGELERCAVTVDPAELPDMVTGIDDPKQQKLKEKILTILRSFAGNDPAAKPIHLRLHFYAAPAEILGDERVQKLRVNRTHIENGRAVPTGESFDLDVSAVISAIGYTIRPIPGLHSPQGSSFPNEEGKVDEGLWAVGWAKRGPSGVIATNRADSIGVVQTLMTQLQGSGKDGPEALDRLLAERNHRPVTFEDWQRIDEKEVGAAASGAPRRKFTSFEELVGAANRAK